MHSLLKHEAYKLLEEEFREVMERSNVPFLKILDINSGLRLVSTLLTPTSKGRYYVRYGILVEYSYDKPFDTPDYSLVKIRMFLTDADGVLTENDSYVKHWSHIIDHVLPDYWQRSNISVPYRLVYVCSKAPFNDEENGMVNQDMAADDDYLGTPYWTCDKWFTVLEIEGERYVCTYIGLRLMRIKSTFLLPLGPSKRLIRLSTYLKPNQDVIGIPLKDFHDRAKMFHPLCKLVKQRMSGKAEREKTPKCIL